MALLKIVTVISRILGTVGEPINPEAWNWYASVVEK